MILISKYKTFYFPRFLTKYFDYFQCHADNIRRSGYTMTKSIIKTQQSSDKIISRRRGRTHHQNDFHNISSVECPIYCGDSLLIVTFEKVNSFMLMWNPGSGLIVHLGASSACPQLQANKQKWQSSTQSLHGVQDFQF